MAKRARRTQARESDADASDADAALWASRCALDVTGLPPTDSILLSGCKKSTRGALLEVRAPLDAAIAAIAQA